MPTQAEKARAFRALHQRDGAFVIPNPWDVGSARILAGLGFEALASSSAGFATSIGKTDYQPGREAVIGHCAGLAAATALPVSGDLENGFGDSPEAAAETIRLAAGAGLVGGSIEDATGRADEPLYPLEAAAERVRAAAEAARGLGFPFTLTARAEGLIRGRPDLGDAIARLQAYQEAGADVLFAPGLSTLEQVASVVRSVDRPVSVLAGFFGPEVGVAELAGAGVRRISVGGLLARLAYGALIHAARQLKQDGSFAFVAETARARGLGRLLGAS